VVSFLLAFRYSGILENRNHDVSETGSVSVLRWGGKAPTQLRPLERANLNQWTTPVKVKVKVTLRLTVSQSVSLGVEPHFTVTVLFLWGALSDERTGLSFVYAAGPCQCSRSRLHTGNYLTVILESSLYSLGADPTENVVSNNSSIVVIGGYQTIARILLTCLFFQRERVYWSVAQKRPLYSRLLHSNNCTCYNILFKAYYWSSS
jgi:hypothetical protein